MQLTLSRLVLHMAAHISGVRPVLAAGAFTSAWPFSIRNRTALIDLPSTCTEADNIRHTQLEGNWNSVQLSAVENNPATAMSTSYDIP